MNRNSALIWLPIVEELGIKSPRTKMIPYDHREIVTYLEGEIPESKSLNQLTGQVINACEDIGWPCFIRTDLASCKHDGPDNYLAKDISRIKHVLCRTIEYNEMEFWLTETPMVIMVRQFLQLDAPFKAFHGLPISREWRFFANGDKVICAHPYWPHDAIEFYKEKKPKRWREQLNDLHVKPSCFGELSTLAKTVAGELGGNWSIDFAMDYIGRWWLIDMATMEDSWHWLGCPNNPSQED